jgi:DNA-binding transcriptional ArsR family regulator
MGWWRVNADTLAGSRFVLSPLAEATASLIALERGAAGRSVERTWLDTHQPAYREWLAGDPVTALFVRAALGRHWIADFLALTPAGEGEPTFGEELTRMREKSPEAARADLTVSLGGPLPARLHRSDLPERAANLLKWVWTETVLPPVPEALGRLLGPARAGVLVLLDTPKSTTQLVALTGQGLGSVGRHLKVLLDARLVQRRRAGRSVLYYRTAAGETLLEAQPDT